MVEEDKSQCSNSMQRVKVYRMSEDGKWDDQGTGHISVDYLERSEDLGLFVVNEEDNETLLLHRISSEDIYRKQEDTIISWRDPDLSTELALSFQETSGCSYIWDNLCSVQRNMHFSSLANETIHNVSREIRDLPPVELSNLPIILKTIVDSGITEQSRLTELMLHHQDFLRKLMELFRVCEDSENIDGLHMIFKIVRGIILLNSTQIFEKIFGDDLIMDTIGCLEYDPQGPRVHHRDFLRKHVVFKKAIPIKDPVVLSKVHQTYRIGYMKDIVFPRSMDEAVVANLNSIIHSNNALVVSLLKDDNAFIKELFTKLKSPTTSTGSRKNLVHFLHEFCTLSKSLQVGYQLRLNRDLVNEGIFDVIANILQSEDKKLVLTATDILILLMNQDSNVLRSYVSQRHDVLFGLLVRNMLTDFGDDMHCQFLEIIRTLLDLFLPGPQKETIVEMFYQKHLGQLIDTITAACPANDDVRKLELSDGGPGNKSPVKPEILLNICDLLCFCVLHHPHRIKCNFLLNNVIDKVLLLTRRRERYLVAAAVKFTRTIISRNDEHLMNHFVKNNLFKPIVDAFISNGNRYNLLNSAVLELFEYIRKENLKILLRYIVETFWDGLAKFEYLSSIVALRVKYDQLLETAGTSTSTDSLSDQRKQTGGRGLEKEEEDYFNEGSDEESALAESTNTKNTQPQLPVVGDGSSNQLPRSTGLVDYDDDDDEDYKPPPRKIPESSEDTEFKLKRKLLPKEEPGAKRLKMKVATAVSMHSTLSRTVLPMKKAATAALTFPKLTEGKNSHGPNLEENKSESTSEERHIAPLDNHVHEQEASPRHSDSLNGSTDNRQLGNDHPLLPTNPSSEMAVEGS